MQRHVIFALLILILAACGGSEDPTATPTATDMPTSTSTEPPPTETSLPEPSVIPTERPERAWFGVGFSEQGGRLTIFVDPGGPAEKGGLENGDILVAINGDAVTAETLVEKFEDFVPGDVITVTVSRADEEQDFEVTLEPMPEGMVDTSNLAAQSTLGISSEVGDSNVRIINVVAGSPAEAAGLQVDDVILAINGTELETPTDIYPLYQSIRYGQEVEITVQRGDETLELVATTPELNLPITQQPDLNDPQSLFQDVITYIPAEQVWQVDNLMTTSLLGTVVGLQAGDRITQINGTMYTPDEFFTETNSITPSDTVMLTVERGGEVIEIEGPGVTAPALVAAVFNHPEDETASNNPPPFVPDSANDNTNSSDPVNLNDLGQQIPPFVLTSSADSIIVDIVWLGIQVRPVTERIAAASGLSVVQGALVLDVQETPSSAGLDIQPGDVIVGVNDTVVDAGNVEALNAAQNGQTMTLTIVRGEENFSVDLTVRRPPQSGGSLPFLGTPNATNEAPQGNPLAPLLTRAVEVTEEPGD